MTTDTRTQTVAELAEPLAASLSLTLWGVEMASGARSIVRVYVQGQDGEVTIDECAKLSRLLGLGLDVEEELFHTPYTLEVSSPGLERVFFKPEQLAGAVGKHITVSLHEPLPGLPGRRKLWGTLLSADNENFTLEVKDVAKPGEDAPVAAFGWPQIKKAQLRHFLPEEETKAQKGRKPAKAKAAPAETTEFETEA